MSRRRPVRTGDLTSLLDVLFIVTFASLVHGARIVERAVSPAAAAPAEKPPAAPASPGPAAALPPAQLRERAVAEVARSLTARPAVVARISGDGALVAVEPEQGTALPLRVPLLARVADADVALEYLGDRSAELRVCTLVRAALAPRPIDGMLVVVAPERPVADLSYALVRGLQRDVRRCAADTGAVAALVDAEAVPGPAPLPLPPPPGAP